jgi:hypothetical protein
LIRKLLFPLKIKFLVVLMSLFLTILFDSSSSS